MLQANEKAGRDARPRCGVRGMMTGAIGRLLRCAALAAVAGLAAGCASPQGAPSVTAPAGYGKDAARRVGGLGQYCHRLTEKGELVTALGLCARAPASDRSEDRRVRKRGVSTCESPVAPDPSKKKKKNNNT